MMRTDRLPKETWWSHYYASEGFGGDRHEWQSATTMIRGVYERLFPPPARRLVSIEERTQTKLPQHQHAITSSPLQFVRGGPPNNHSKPTATVPRQLFCCSPSKLVPLVLSSYLILSVCYLLSVDPVRMAAHHHHSSFSRQSRLVSDATAGSPPITPATNGTVLRRKDAHRVAVASDPHPHIPNVLIFTHSENLLEYEPPRNYNGSPLSALDRELQVLSSNVRRTVELHRDAAVRFLTDDDCEQEIARAFPNLPRLPDYFRRESTGMFRGDLCRGAALYQSGGIYLDVDVGVRMRLWDALDPSTTFATVRVHRQSAHPGSFFQAFIAVAPRHPILRRYVELFDEYYRGQHPQYKGKPLGVVLLKRAYDDAVAHNASLQESAELWQELLYRFEWQHTLLKGVPPPTWGTRRACKFIVLSSAQPLVAPLYSRIADSRMCPTNASSLLSSSRNNAPNPS